MWLRVCVRSYADSVHVRECVYGVCVRGCEVCVWGCVCEGSVHAKMCLTVCVRSDVESVHVWSMCESVCVWGVDICVRLCVFNGVYGCGRVCMSLHVCVRGCGCVRCVRIHVRGVCICNCVWESINLWVWYTAIYFHYLWTLRARRVWKLTLLSSPHSRHPPTPHVAPYSLHFPIHYFLRPSAALWRWLHPIDRCRNWGPWAQREMVAVPLSHRELVFGQVAAPTFRFSISSNSSA